MFPLTSDLFSRDTLHAQMDYITHYHSIQAHEFGQRSILGFLNAKQFTGKYMLVQCWASAVVNNMVIYNLSLISEQQFNMHCSDNKRGIKRQIEIQGERNTPGKFVCLLRLRLKGWGFLPYRLLSPLFSFRGIRILISCFSWEFLKRLEGTWLKLHIKQK